MFEVNWYWATNIAVGVFLGGLWLVAVGVLIFVVAPWLSDRVRSWRRRRMGAVLADGATIIGNSSTNPNTLGQRGAVSLRLVLLILLPFAAGILIATKAGDWFAGLFGSPPPEIVHVDPATIEKARVDPTPGLLERLQLGRVQPTQVRIGTAPSAAGKKRVAEYCQPVAVGQLVQTSAKPGPVPDSATKRGTGPRILPDFNGRVNGNKAFLSSTLNDGTPWDATYRPRGRWTFASSGDSVVVRSERFWSRFTRGALRCGVVAGAGAGIGYLTNSRQPLQGATRGAVIGGGTCAVLELAF